MRLRSTIRPPERYGEADAETPTAALLQSMRQARERSCDVQAQGNPGTASGPNGSYLRDPRARPRIVNYNPTLPPAAFPTLNEPVPTPQSGPNRGNGSGQDGGNVQLRNRQEQRTGEEVQPVEAFDDGLGHIPMEGIENYVVSNTERNAIYVGNMTTMAGAGQIDKDVTVDLEDSDLEEPVEATEALGAKASVALNLVERRSIGCMDPANRKLHDVQILNPTWDDLHPALQVEIIENMLKTENWRSICGKLDLKADNRRKVHTYLETRNRQVQRENKQLARMREKQLRALMRIDNSDVKRRNVPHQLVLRRIMRKTTRKLLESEYTDLLMCQAAHVLAARQYLHQHELPRSLAGDWGHSLVVLHEQKDDNLQGPEKFTWKDGQLTFDSEIEYLQKASRTGEEDCATKKSNFINNIGKGSTMNPQILLLDNDDDESTPEWHRNLQDPDPEPRLQPEYRGDGIIRINVGTQQAAHIEPYRESRGPFRYASLPSDPPPTISPSLITLPFEPNEETPTRLATTPRAWSNMRAVCSNSVAERSEEPIPRSLGGCWSLDTLDPAIGQARYTQQMEEARREREQLRLSEEMRKECRKLFNLRMEVLERRREAAARSVPSTSPDSNEPFVNDPTLPTLDDMFVDSHSRTHEDLDEAIVNEMMDQFIEFEQDTAEQSECSTDGA